MFKKLKNKSFDYQPRYYKPDEDQQEKRKRKLGFRSNQGKSTRKKSPITWVLMLLVIIYIIAKYNGMV